MPLLSRLFLRVSFIYLALGLLVGILLAGQTLWPVPAFVSALEPVYIHLLTVGWLTFLIFGVAYWMFPKYSLERPHGNDLINWTAFFLLNIGLILRIVAEPSLGQGASVALSTLLVISAFFQWLGGILFIINLWKRVKVK